MMFVRCWLIAVLILAGPSLAHATGCRAVVVRKAAIVKEAVVIEKAVAAVVTPVVATFLPVAVPIYSAIYQPPPVVPAAPAYPAYGAHPVGGGYGAQPVGAGYGQAAYGQNGGGAYGGDPALAQLAAELARINQRLDRIEGIPAGQQAPVPGQQVPGQPPQQPVPGQQRQPGPMTPADGAQQNAPARALALLQKNCASCHDEGRSKASGGGVTLTSGSQLAQITPELLGTMVEAIASKRMPKGNAARMSDAERLELLGALVGK